MAILKHTYKVAITCTSIGYDIVINEFATDGIHREYERRHHTWALTSHGADRAPNDSSAASNDKTSETNTHANTPSNRTLMNHKPNRFNDILTNIVTGVTITAWGTAVILLLIKLAIWVFQ